MYSTLHVCGMEVRHTNNTRTYLVTALFNVIHILCFIVNIYTF